LTCHLLSDGQITEGRTKKHNAFVEGHLCRAVWQVIATISVKLRSTDH
jgi:hypothetical protein